MQIICTQNIASYILIFNYTHCVYIEGIPTEKCSDYNLASIVLQLPDGTESNFEGVIYICMRVSNEFQWVPLCYNESLSKGIHEAVAHAACRQKGLSKASNNAVEDVK